VQHPEDFSMPMPTQTNPKLTQLNDAQTNFPEGWFQGLKQKIQSWTFRLSGLLTYEKPITEFPGDMTFLGPITVSLKAGVDIPSNCVGARFINVTGVTTMRVNGGGLRTVLTGDTLQQCEIQQLEITVTTGSCTLQAVGTGV
jgi:hypothetical protein